MLPRVDRIAVCERGDKALRFYDLGSRKAGALPLPGRHQGVCEAKVVSSSWQASWSASLVEQAL